MVARPDNPDEKFELKAFCAEIINDHKALEKRCGDDWADRDERMLNTPGPTEMIIRK
jgi:hypothetical protein